MGWCRGWSGHGRHLSVSTQVRGVQPVLARRRSDSHGVQAAQRGQRKQVAYHRRARLSRRLPRVQPHADEEHLERCRTYEPADGEVRRTRPAIWPTSTTSVARGPASVKHYVGFSPVVPASSATGSTSSPRVPRRALRVSRRGERRDRQDRSWRPRSIAPSRRNPGRSRGWGARHQATTRTVPGTARFGPRSTRTGGAADPTGPAPSRGARVRHARKRELTRPLPRSPVCPHSFVVKSTFAS